NAFSATAPLVQRLDRKPAKCIAGVAARGCPPVILRTLLAGEIQVKRATRGKTAVQGFDLLGRLPLLLPRTRGLSLVLMLRDGRGLRRGCSVAAQAKCAAVIWSASRGRVFASTITVGAQRFFLQPSGALSLLPNEGLPEAAQSPILGQKQL